MNKLNKWLLNSKDESKIIRRGTIWNLYSSVLNSAMTAVIILFISIFGEKDSIGIFSLATGIAYQCQALGNFGMRNFQVSDVNNEYTFFDYLNVRIFSSILMYVALFAYAFQTNYTFEKSMIILTYGIYRSVDALEDLFHGEFQRNNRLDIGVIFQSFRFTISLVFMMITLAITNNLVIACIVSSIVSIILFLYQNISIIRYFVTEKYNFNFLKFKKIIIFSLPICVCGFLSMYLINAPKYAIDQYLTNQLQTFYGILILPVTVISILSTVVYRPYISYISKAWVNRDLNEFKKIIMRQVVYIFILTFLIIFAGYILGLTLLEMIYKINLHDYMFEFLLLLFGGGVYTLSQFFGIVVTIIRRQNLMFFNYITVFIIIRLLSKYLTINLGILGASLIYVLSATFLSLGLLLIVIKDYLKEKRKK